MNDPKKPFDVALSFFARDVGTARQLYERLSEDLSVFFYERAQDEVTGREGDEVFRTPFLTARLAVILFRNGYGEKGWTGVERTAIGEACLKQGYKNLFVVAMEPYPTIPNWIPTTHIYADISLLPLEQLVGAIKLKLLELGVRPEPMTMERRAKLHQINEKYEIDRKFFRAGPNGMEVFYAELAKLFGEIDRKCTALRISQIKVEERHNSGRCVIRNDKVSMAVYCRFSGYGTIDREELTVEEYKAQILMPEERRMYLDGRGPSPSHSDKYELELTRAREPAWKPQHDGGYFPAPVLAERIMVRFLELTDEVTVERNRRRN